MYSMFVKMSTQAYRFGNNKPTQFQTMKVSDIKKFDIKEFPVRVVAPSTDAKVYGYQLVHIMFEDKVIFKDELQMPITLNDNTIVGIIPKMPEGYKLYNFFNQENQENYIGILITIMTKRSDKEQHILDIDGNETSVKICTTKYMCYCFDQLWKVKTFGNVVIRPIRPLRSKRN